MTTLNRFVTMARNLQELFRHAESGEPLVNGLVYFYKDTARTTPKPVYKLSGSPPNYSYTALENPVPLTGIGSFSDGDGNDIIPHYFPYEGTPDDTDGTIELYYIVVKDEDGNIQWTREGFPETTTSSSGDGSDFTNFIPNGQFLFHNDIPANLDTGSSAGQITEETTDIAQGGWTFNRAGGAASTDFVTFEEIAVESGVVNPSTNPKYGARIKCTSSDANTKDLRIKFGDVNKFASATQEYTLYMEAKSESGGTLSTAVYLIKNFGDGGDIEEETEIGTAIIQTSYNSYSINFLFGTNIGKVIGPNDYVQLAIRFPSASLYDAVFTDFVLMQGTQTIEAFPAETDADMRTRGLAGWMPTPNPDGSDLYLLPRLTKAGFEFDRSIIGKVEMCAYERSADNKAIDANELDCDGTGYPAYGHSSVGIPYRRLHTRIYDSTAKIPLYGCGREYMNAFVSDLTPATEVRFETNKAGSTTAINAGTSGLTVKTVRTGQDFNLTGYRYGTALLYGMGNIVGAENEEVKAADSGFTVSQLTFPATARQVFSILTIAASAITTGHHFTFSNTTTKYYIWFKKDGAGSDPAPATYTSGGFVDLNGSYTADDVSSCVRVALAGCQVSTIIAVAASSITPGTYFSVYSNPGAEKRFNFYFVKDGVGSAPVVAGTPIAVNILAGDTAAQVADKIRIANNNAFLGVPDFRNAFLRGYSSSSTWDYDAATRFTFKSVLAGNNLGTFQLSQITSHTHTSSTFNGVFQNLPSANKASTADTIDYQNNNITPIISATGGSETRGFNGYVIYTIKY